MARLWQFTTINLGTGDEVELAAAKDWKYTEYLADAPQLSFSIDGRHPHAQALVELESDVVGYRAGVKLFRGRITTPQDSYSAETGEYKVSFTAFGYRQLLDNLITYDGESYVKPNTYGTVEQTDVAWNLINQAQGHTGVDLGITRGVLTNSPFNIGPGSFEAGQTIRQIIDTLSQTDPGFEYEVDAELDFNVWSPTRGTDNGFLIGIEDVKSFTRQLDPSYFANALRATGDQTVTPQTLAVTGINNRPEGRWERQLSFPEVLSNGLLQKKLQAELAERSVKRYSYAMDLRIGVWQGKDSLWVGDTVQLDVLLGRIDDQQKYRVHQMDIALDTEGKESVSVVLGIRRPALDKKLRDMLQANYVALLKSQGQQS